MLRFLGLLILASCTLARPASYDEYLSVEGDAADVGSMHREVRAPAPVGIATEVQDLLFAGTSPKKTRQAEGDKKSSEKNTSGKSDEGGLYKQYGSDAEGEKGFEKQTYSKGDHGYKSLDTFHKQDGDKYEFERHSAFGKGHGGHESGKSGQSGSYKSDDDAGDHEGAGTIVETHYAEPEGEVESASYTDEGSDGGESANIEEGGEGEHHISGGEGGHYSSEGEGGHYNSGGEGGHYTSGGDGGHHVSTADGSSGSFTHGGESGEHYSAGSGGEGSYGTHGSYDSGSHGSDAGHEGGSFY